MGRGQSEEIVRTERGESEEIARTERGESEELAKKERGQSAERAHYGSEQPDSWTSKINLFHELGSE